MNLTQTGILSTENQDFVLDFEIISYICLNPIGTKIPIGSSFIAVGKSKDLTGKLFFPQELFV